MNMSSKVGLLVIALVFIGSSYWSVYELGKSEEAKANLNRVNIQLEKAKQETLVQQKAKDQISSAFFLTTKTLTEKEYELQKRIEDLMEGSNRISTGSVLDSTTSNWMRIINESSDCPTLPNSNNQPYIITKADGFYEYAARLAIDRCKIAEQLDSLISACQ